MNLIVWPYSGRGLFGVDNGSAQGVGYCWWDDLHSVLCPGWLFKLSKCRGGNVGWYTQVSQEALKLDSRCQNIPNIFGFGWFLALSHQGCTKESWGRAGGYLQPLDDKQAGQGATK